ncbi:MAG: hypothetical protein M1819_000534 [Sarea resinae]|nr:MAG: hypothetical protein M1819_000534 [Sarea resinae]
MKEYQSKGLQLIYDQSLHADFTVSATIHRSPETSNFAVALDCLQITPTVPTEKSVAQFLYPSTNFIMGFRMLSNSRSLEVWRTARVPNTAEVESDIWSLQFCRTTRPAAEQAVAMWYRLESILRKTTNSQLEYVNVTRASINNKDIAADRYNLRGQKTRTPQETSGGSMTWVVHNKEGPPKGYEFTNRLANPKLVAMMEKLDLNDDDVDPDIEGSEREDE